MCRVLCATLDIVRTARNDLRGCWPATLQLAGCLELTVELSMKGMMSIFETPAWVEG